MICSSLCRVPFIAVSSSWVAENSHSRWSSFRGLGHVTTHRRHFLQQSEYTICLIFDNDWRFEQYDTVFDKGREQQGFCWKYTMPASERPKVLKLLDEHNLNAFSLFGSEESMMGTLATREFLET